MHPLLLWNITFVAELALLSHFLHPANPSAAFPPQDQSLWAEAAALHQRDPSDPGEFCEEAAGPGLRRLRVRSDGAGAGRLPPAEGARPEATPAGARRWDSTGWGHREGGKTLHFPLCLRTDE